MKRILTITAAMLLLSGCFHEMHEMQPSEYGENTPVGYLATALQWAQESDAETPVHNLTFALTGAGASFSRSFANEEEASLWLQQLPVGSYELLVTANMSEADGFVLSGLPATKADPASEDILVTLKDGIDDILQAWYSKISVTISEDDLTIAEAELKGLLSNLSVVLTNVPSGTDVAISVGGMARCVDLTTERPGSEYYDDVPLGTRTECFLFPTADGLDRCTVTLVVTAPSGKELTCVCDAPAMQSGVRYVLTLDYNTLRPFLHLDTCAIGPWEDGWSISGAVTDPQE